MHKLRYFYNVNKVTIWFITLGLIFLILIIQILNNNVKVKSNRIAQDMLTKENANYDTTTEVENKKYNTYAAVISNYKNLREKEEQEAITKTLYDFIDDCKNKDISKAYSYLSKNCKEKMFNSLEEFENSYINKIFNGDREYKITPWILGENSIYKISIFESSMASGKINSSNQIDSYYTVIEEDGEYKINLNKYINTESLNRTFENEYLKIELISKDLYMDYEEYKIKVFNKTQNTILLDGCRNSNTLYIENSVENIYNSNINEIPENLLTIMPYIYVERKIKFNREYTENVTSKKIIFKDVILNYNEFKEDKNNYDKNIKIEVPV